MTDLQSISIIRRNLIGGVKLESTIILTSDQRMTFIRSIYGENKINIAMQTEQEFQIDADWTVVSTNQMTVMVGPI